MPCREKSPDTDPRASSLPDPSARKGRYSKFCLRMTTIGGVEMQSEVDNATFLAPVVRPKKNSHDSLSAVGVVAHRDKKSRLCSPNSVAADACKARTDSKNSAVLPLVTTPAASEYDGVIGGEKCVALPPVASYYDAAGDEKDLVLLPPAQLLLHGVTKSAARDNDATTDEKNLVLPPPAQLLAQAVTKPTTRDNKAAGGADFFCMSPQTLTKSTTSDNDATTDEKKLVLPPPAKLLANSVTKSTTSDYMVPFNTKNPPLPPTTNLLTWSGTTYDDADHQDATDVKKSRAYLCSKCGAEKKGHQCPFAPENMTKSAFRLVHPKRSHKSLVTLRKAAARVTV